MLVLGIETTCDETSCALVRDGYEILSLVISSQAAIHDAFGGVVPELACRQHIDIISQVLMQAVAEANISLEEIDLISVAKGPGLIGALLIGMNFGKSLAWALKKPLIGINHIEAHLYAAVMSHVPPPHLPALGIVLSGGHTSIVDMQAIGSYWLIGETVDDAIGEAFDKVAKILGLGYPGGPIIEALAKKGDPGRFPFRSGHVKGYPLHFSFSGIKTAVLYTVREMSLTEADICDIAASFQRAVFEDVLHKTKIALSQYKSKALYLGGGVTRNETLRALFAKHLDTACFWPENSLCLDNAAMIAGLAYHAWHAHPVSSLFELEPETRIPFQAKL